MFVKISSYCDDSFNKNTFVATVSIDKQSLVAFYPTRHYARINENIQCILSVAIFYEVDIKLSININTTHIFCFAVIKVLTSWKSKRKVSPRCSLEAPL